MGLREIKKKRSREAILKAARKLFFSKGFDGTTIEEIAEKAEVAVGTVYNYFQSKSSIILSITEEDTSAILSTRPGLEGARSGREIIWKYISSLMKGMSMYPRLLLRELLREAWSSSQDTLGAGLLEQDLTLLDGLEKLLGELASAGLIRSGTNIRHAALAIYGAVMTAMLWYAAVEDRTSKQMMSSLEGMLQVLFTGLENEGSRS